MKGSHYLCTSQGNKVLGDVHELWTDGLLCAYEFIPGAKKKYKVGGKFGGSSGAIQGKFDAELSVHEPQVVQQIAALTNSADHEPNSLEAQSQGNLQHKELEVRKRSPAPPKSSDVQEEPKQMNESISDHSTLSNGRNLHHHRKKEIGNHWLPIGWDRLAELVATVEVSLLIYLL